MTATRHAITVSRDLVKRIEAMYPADHPSVAVNRVLRGAMETVKGEAIRIYERNKNDHSRPRSDSQIIQVESALYDELLRYEDILFGTRKEFEHNKGYRKGKTVHGGVGDVVDSLLIHALDLSGPDIPPGLYRAILARKVQIKTGQMR